MNGTKNSGGGGGEYKPSKEEAIAFVSRVNSYLGMMGHFNTVELRQKVIEEINFYSFNWIRVKNMSNRSLEIRDRLIG